MLRPVLVTSSVIKAAGEPSTPNAQLMLETPIRKEQDNGTAK